MESTERKLASIQRIEKLIPIEGKDNIVLAQICGWTVIVAKDAFQEGDLCCYFEIDSILPDLEIFAGVKKRSPKLRIKTMKMGNVYSQGFAISLKEMEQAFSQLSVFPPKRGKLVVGYNLTKKLQVEKYEEGEYNQPEKQRKYGWFKRCLMCFEWYRNWEKRNRADSAFPYWVSKTDEIRAEYISPRIKEWSKGKIKFHQTIKMDGQSTTFSLKKKGFKWDFAVCSRNLRLNPKDDSKAYIFDEATKHGIQRLLERLKDQTFKEKYGKQIEAISIQAEICGPKIQKNRIHLIRNELYVFNLIIRLFNGTVIKLNPEDYKDIMAMYSLGLKTVPYIKEDTIPDNIEDLRKLTNLFYDKDQKYRIEGIVFRNYDLDISFKCINPEYLVEHGL